MFLITAISTLLAILSSILFGWIILQGYRLLPIKQFSYLLLFSMCFGVIGILKAIAILLHNIQYVVLLEYTAHLTLFMAFGFLLLYMESIWRSTTGTYLIGGIIISFIAEISNILTSPAQFITVNGYLVKFSAPVISALIAPIIIVSLFVYEFYKAFPVIKRSKFTRHNIYVMMLFITVSLIGIFIIYVAPIALCIEILIVYYGDLFASSTLILSSALVIRRNPSKSLAPVNVFAAIFATKIGLEISHKVLDPRYKKLMPTITSLLAAVLSLTTGIAERTFSDTFQLYKLENMLLVIYHGKKSVFTIVTDIDSKILRELVKNFAIMFEERVGDVPNALIYEDIQYVADEVLSLLEKILLE